MLLLFNPTPPCGAPLRAGEQLAVTLVTEEFESFAPVCVISDVTELKNTCDTPQGMPHEMYTVKNVFYSLIDMPSTENPLKRSATGMRFLPESCTSTSEM